MAKKWNLYTLLNSDRNKKDAQKDEDIRDLKFLGFFKLTGRNFSTLFWVNLIFTLSNFPVFFALGFFLLSETSLSPQTLGFSNLYGALSGGEMNPLSSILYAVSGSPITRNEFGTSFWPIFFLILACLVLFTFGPANCGAAHILRSILRGEPIFFFRDYFDTVRKNLKQGIFLGIFDILFFALTLIDVVAFLQNYGNSFFFVIAFFLTIAIFFIYSMARMYIYLLCITFDLSFFKIIKNAVIFAFLGFKRNFLALLGQAFVAYLTVLLISSGILTALGVLLPFVIVLSLGMFMSYYAAYKPIKKYMIEPYYDENGDPLPETAEETQ